MRGMEYLSNDSPKHENSAALGSFGSGSASAETEASETGRNNLSASEAHALEGAPSPRLVIRGESFNPLSPEHTTETCTLYTDGQGHTRATFIPQPNHSAHPFAALTDWLNLTFPFHGTESAVADLLTQIRAELSDKFGSMRERRTGLNGFKRSFEFDADGAMFAYGGQRGKAYLSLSGKACALVANWGRAYEFVKSLNARITRWDGAVDDFAGAYSVDLALEWYLKGQFGTHGNQPRMRQDGNWAVPDGLGRSFYIGRRQNGKMLRIYEKGKQLGDPLSSWVRWELELHSRDRVIPPEVLLMPGQYVAGAYTCLGWIHERASRVRTIQKTDKISYDYLIENAKASYGSLLYVMRQRESSDGAILDKLVREGLPRRLKLPVVEDSDA